VGAKRQIAVPLTIPALPNLELTWEVTVRRANVGVSAVFLPDDASDRSSGPAILTVASGGKRHPELNADGSERRGFLSRFKRQSSKAESDLGDDEDGPVTSMGRKLVTMPAGSLPVHPYEVRNREVRSHNHCSRAYRKWRRRMTTLSLT
jgi:hypothetical protein